MRQKKEWKCYHLLETLVGNMGCREAYDEDEKLYTIFIVPKGSVLANQYGPEFITKADIRKDNLIHCLKFCAL